MWPNCTSRFCVSVSEHQLTGFVKSSLWQPTSRVNVAK